MTKTPEQRANFLDLMNMEILHRGIGLPRMFITTDCGQPGGTFRWINIHGARPVDMSQLNMVAVKKVIKYYTAIGKLSFHGSCPPRLLLYLPPSSHML